MTQLRSAEIFNSKGNLHLKNLIPKEVCYHLTHLLSLKGAYGIGGDPQVPNSKGVGHGEMGCEVILESVWPIIEEAVGEELFPTYSYARLYGNGDELKIHSDRPSCEISVTIQLGRSHHYAWPIYMGGHRVDLAEGDGVVYKGCDILHWREPCNGPEDYYSGQVFCHYVRANGPHVEYGGDRRWPPNENGEIRLPFYKKRMSNMFNK
jgi:hypothetical protein